ncbi:MAG: flagellar hook-basal body complex protein FliE [Spirochaetaceae bacterium]|nr:flagellar hook-basal body complex protein FliE [Spirochaetaceae bacterium]|tara:strand:- start:2991 stop:3359 length:369 start_codon:yes stop_codon:yes gene_type:complete
MDIFSTTGIQTSSMIPRPVGAQTTNPLQMNKGHDRHMQIASVPPDPNKVVTNFSDALTQALGQVEQLNTRSKELTRQSIYDPDSVEVHDVMIAAQKSKFALNLTKTVADGFVRTIRELTAGR